MRGRPVRRRGDRPRRRARRRCRGRSTSMQALAIASSRGGMRASSSAAPTAASRAAGEGSRKATASAPSGGRRTGAAIAPASPAWSPSRSATWRHGPRRAAASGACSPSDAAIGGGDQRHVAAGGQRVEPHLQHVERLGRDQPRAVGLRVLEGQVQVGHPHHRVARPGTRIDERVLERPVARRSPGPQRPGAGGCQALQHRGGRALARRSVGADDTTDGRIHGRWPRRGVRTEQGEEVGEGARGHGVAVPVVAQATGPRRAELVAEPRRPAARGQRPGRLARWPAASLPWWQV